MGFSLWVDGLRSLPLLIPPGSRPETAASAISLARAVLRASEGQTFIGWKEWERLVGDAGIRRTPARAIYAAASRRNGATLQTIILAILLQAVDTTNEHHLISHRGESIAHFFHDYSDSLIELLLWSSLGHPPSASLIVSSLSHLDSTIHGSLNQHKPRPFSHIAQILWKGEVTLSEVSLTLREHIVTDPFLIDDTPVVPPSPPSHKIQRRMTLGTKERKRVTIRSWKNLQILNREVYSDGHIRLSDTFDKRSSLFLPYKNDSVIVSDASGTLLLGTACMVVLHRVRDASISVACRRLVIWNCRDGVAEEMSSIGLTWSMNAVQKEPILMDDSTVTTTDVEKFIVQPVPFPCEDDDILMLLDSLPEYYRRHWIDIEKRARLNMKEGEDENRPTNNKTGVDQQ